MHPYMRSALLAEGPQRTYAVIFATGDEVMAGLIDFAERNQVDAASLTAIGGFQAATLAYFDIGRKEYLDIPCAEQVEVLTLAGDVARKEDGGPGLHMHAVLGRRDGTTLGGHVKEAVVRPTLEVMLTETPSRLRRTYDPDVGLPLIDLRASETS